MSIPFSVLSSKKAWITVLIIIVCGSLALFFMSRSRKPGKADFSKYIESNTAGVVSKGSSIVIRLSATVPTGHTKSELLAGDVFEISPSVNGKAFWTDARTIEFKPDEPLKPATTYEVRFNLEKITPVEKGYEEFDFDFETIKPDYSVELGELTAASNSSPDKMKLTGTILTADAEEASKVEKVIRVDNAPGTAITWKHDGFSKNHQFIISNISRQPSKRSSLHVAWDGDPLSVESKSSKNFDVPLIGEFKVLGIRAADAEEQYVQIWFSNPVRVGQELSGLAGISGQQDLAYTIDGSVVKVYGTGMLKGDFSAFVNEGIEDIFGKKIRRGYTANVFFENRLPSVNIPGKGVILPGSGKLTMPFEAVNLKAVDVSVIRVYESNVPQYFQTNGFDGRYELRLVGKPVVQKTIRLDADKSLDLGKKNRFMLDLDRLLRAEPGAIYRVIIGFRDSYSVFNCKVSGARNNSDEDNESGYSYDGDNTGRVSDEDDEFWSRYDNFYPEGYVWEERNDPCSKSYYMKERWASRNIIASNIGLITKRGADNSMLVAVTNLLDASPMPGTDLELLDYQKQVILKTRTDGDGIARFILKRKPYLLVAKKGTERGYLKLDDGSSLPFSRFNVGGDPVQSGLKGFIYGERGVWRPGDSIFLSFILEDKLKTLPADHPVELELYTPMGQLYRKVTKFKSTDGFYSFHLATGPSSPTGNWMTKIKVGGAVFEKSLKIETIMPNRLKINLSFGDLKALTEGEGNSASLSAQWLFGATAQNLKAKVDVFLAPQETVFPAFKNYVFDDPTRAFNTQIQPVFEGNLDNAGRATIKAEIHIDQQAPGQLRANFLVKVFEPGGSFSIQQANLPYNPYQGYVGLKTPEGSSLSGMLVTGKDHLLDLAAVDTKGAPFAGMRNVVVELYRIQWRWWWDETGDELTNFTQDQTNKLVRTETVRLVNGRGKWTLHLNNNDWGRYLIKVRDPQTGHSTGKIIYADWPNWSERLQQNNSTEAAMLSFTSDKQSYKVGEQATITLPTGETGRALISFENGSKVLKTEWIDTRKGQTQYKFKIGPEMAPNIFVTVSLLQHHAQTVNDLPIRMYGSIPLVVEDPATLLRPVISMPATLKPETPSKITVSEASGKEMIYTVAIVDEGLLDLTNFKTPDAHRSFYAREALGVKTWDLFDYVIGAYGKGLERILSIGGDMAGLNNKNVAISRFKPVVKFLGPFRLAAGEKQTRTFTLPQYIGSVRAMIVAGKDGAYGFAEKAVAVKKPLMVLATLPRVVGPGEKIDLPVDVFTTEGRIRSVTAEVQSDLFTNLAGNNRKTVTFQKPGDQIVSFSLDVKNKIGSGRVRVIVRSGNETAVTDVQLTIRNPNPEITRTVEKEIGPGQTWAADYSGVGVMGSNKASLEVSAIPALNLTRRLSYLVQYPHGCVEQITSGAFPQLYLGQITDLTDRQKAEAERNIKSAINRLATFQVSGGGLSYWPGDPEAEEWGTNYAGHFIVAAQAKGYAVPQGLIEQWKKFQRQKALSWEPDTRSFYGADLLQSYRLYVLALAGSPEIGAMNRLKEFRYLGAEAKWRLAAAYKLAGQPEVGLAMISRLSADVKPYKQLRYTFGSDLRDQAMMLETLTLLGQRAKAQAMLRKVAARLSQDNWYSTQTTAWSLLAIAEYCGDNRSGSKMNFEYVAGTQKGKVASGSYLWQSAVASPSGKVLVKNSGSNRLYLRFTRQGQPLNGDLFPSTNNAEILSMSVAYFTLAGKPVNIASMKQGTDFVAQVVVKNPGQRGRYDNLALTQIFPSGWEILNTRLMDNGEAFRSSAADHRDIRDDRVNTYFSLGAGRDATYYVLLNAAYTGRYYLPPASCEAMYDQSINAVQKGQWVNVVK